MRACSHRVLTLLACVAVAGCGSSHHQPAVAPGSADPTAARVVRDWADALRRSDLDAAADLFALPSRVQLIVGAPLVLVVDHSDAVAFNDSLPCGGRLMKADRRGRYVDALFLLSDRPGSACDAPGGTARAAFVVRDGKITEWRRVGAEPGDQRYEKRGSPRIGPLV